MPDEYTKEELKALAEFTGKVEVLPPRTHSESYINGTGGWKSAAWGRMQRRNMKFQAMYERRLRPPVDSARAPNAGMTSRMEIVRKMRESGASYAEMMRAAGVSKTTLGRYLKELGLTNDYNYRHQEDL